MGWSRCGEHWDRPEPAGLCSHHQHSPVDPHPPAHVAVTPDNDRMARTQSSSSHQSSTTSQSQHYSNNCSSVIQCFFSIYVFGLLNLGPKCWNILWKICSKAYCPARDPEVTNTNTGNSQHFQAQFSTEMLKRVSTLERKWGFSLKTHFLCEKAWVLKRSTSSCCLLWKRAESWSQLSRTDPFSVSVDSEIFFDKCTI